MNMGNHLCYCCCWLIQTCMLRERREEESGGGDREGGEKWKGGERLRLRWEDRKRGERIERGARGERRKRKKREKRRQRWGGGAKTISLCHRATKALCMPVFKVGYSILSCKTKAPLLCRSYRHRSFRGPLKGPSPLQDALRRLVKEPRTGNCTQIPVYLQAPLLTLSFVANRECQLPQLDVSLGHLHQGSSRDSGLGFRVLGLQSYNACDNLWT